MEYKEADLIEAARHLAFDMFHFRLYAQMYREKTHQSNEHAQAILYALLLHFRLLLHFFYGKAAQDDCCAEHFRILKDFEAKFPRVCHTRPAWEPDVRIHLNKRLVHFTATRWDKHQPNMDGYATYFPEITKLIQTFQKALPPPVKGVFDERMWQLGLRYNLGPTPHKLT